MSRSLDYERAIGALDQLRHATWFAEYLQRIFQQIRHEERERSTKIISAAVQKLREVEQNSMAIGDYALSRVIRARMILEERDIP